MAQHKGCKKSGGRQKGTPNKRTERTEAIERWEKLGLYKLADRAIKTSLSHPKTMGEMARWLYDHKIGKAPLNHNIEGGLDIGIKGYAEAWDKILKSNK